MAKYAGKIGFVLFDNSAPGVVKEVDSPKFYRGDLLENSRRLQSADQVNDNVTVNNRISIIADPYAKENFHAIRYAEFMGVKWIVTNISVEYPRLVLTLGGVYNGAST